MNTLLQPSESDDAEAIAAAYLYEAKGGCSERADAGGHRCDQRD